MDNRKRVCSACGELNAPESTVCQHCGEDLPLLLPERVAERNPEASITVKKTELAKETLKPGAGGGIALVVRGFEQPVFFSGEEIILGRYDPNKSHPVLDLTPYNAGSLGVSRRHARISRVDNVYVIEDLNSTNGTWVNHTRLPAGKKHGLYNGAVVQLGQLVLNFYLDSMEAAKTVHERISFKSGSERLTPQYLATRITPYINALAGVQAVCDEMMARSPSQIEIETINIDGPEIISVRITGAHEALKLAKGHLKHWRKEHDGKITQFESIKQLLKMSTGPLMLGTNGNGGTGDNDKEQTARKLGRELREAEMRLALEFLREISLRDSEDCQPYVEKILKPLHVLAFSPLYVTTGSGTLAS